jgi:cytoplasmic iron level regulating protein YaaA (DUF328/UPF0246 family)
MPKPNFSILLAPAQRKETGGNPFAPDMFDYRSSSTFNFFKELNEKRRELIGVLQQDIRESDDLESLFGIKGDYLEEAVEANRNLYDAPLMSAFDRYSPGTTYESIDFENLPTGAQRRLLENGVIFSGLFGLLRPDDLIPNYRLRMDDDLPGVGRVYKYWRPHVSPILNRELEGRWVWDLLPRAHRRVWNDEHTYERKLRIKFYKETVTGERSPVTHGVKELRGSLISFVVEETVEDMEDFREWEHPEGYVLDEEATTYDDEAKTTDLVMVQREGWEERRRKRKERERLKQEREEREKAEA